MQHKILQYCFKPVLETSNPWGLRTTQLEGCDSHLMPHLKECKPLFCHAGGEGAKAKRVPPQDGNFGALYPPIPP